MTTQGCEHLLRHAPPRRLLPALCDPAEPPHPVMLKVLLVRLPSSLVHFCGLFPPPPSLCFFKPDANHQVLEELFEE